MVSAIQILSISSHRVRGRVANVDEPENATIREDIHSRRISNRVHNVCPNTVAHPSSGLARRHPDRYDGGN
jgi:hypothetical protein